MSTLPDTASRPGADGMESRPGLLNVVVLVFGSFLTGVIVGGLAAAAGGPGWAVVGFGAMTWLLSMLVLMVGVELKQDRRPA